MVAAPGVVRARAAVRLQGAAEFGCRERSGQSVRAHLLRRRIEGRDRLAQLLQQRILRRLLRTVRIEATQLAEEYLTPDPELMRGCS